MILPGEACSLHKQLGTRIPGLVHNNRNVVNECFATLLLHCHLSQCGISLSRFQRKDIQLFFNILSQFTGIAKQLKYGNSTLGLNYVGKCDPYALFLSVILNLVCVY